MTIFQSIGNFFTNFFDKVKPELEAALTVANKVVNIMKTFVNSPGGQTIEAILEAFAPGTANVVIGLLNTFFADFNLVSTVAGTELAKTPADIAADGLAAAAKLTGNSKIIALQNIAAIIGHGIATVNGAGSTFQQATVLAPVVHDPTLLGVTVQPPQNAATDLTNVADQLT